MTLISPDYLELQKQLHEAGNYGISSRRWANAARTIIEREDCKTVLDYGCGKGKLKEELGDIREYDPAIPGKDAEPEPADLVVCTDVLEHIEPDRLDDVLRHLRSLTNKRLFFCVSLRPAEKTLPDGRNAHLIVESADWWREQIEKYFWITEFTEGDEFELYGVAEPVTVVGTVKAVGVMRDERIKHVRSNVIKTPRRIPNIELKPHNGLAIIVCYGPSLKDTYPLIKRQQKKLGGTLVSVSGAHDFLRGKGITPDIHVECDPRFHKGKMIKKRSLDTQYLMASCCHPDVIDMLKGHNLTLWHLYNGPESFEIRDIRSEELASMIPGGGSVGLRTISLLYFLGFRHFIIHGMDSSFDSDGQHAGSHSGKEQKSIVVRPAITIDGKPIRSDQEYTTSPVLISYANHMLKDLRNGRYPDAHFHWYGRGLFQEMLRLQNMKAAKDPSYFEPVQYERAA